VQIDIPFVNVRSSGTQRMKMNYRCASDDSFGGSAVEIDTAAAHDDGFSAAA